MIKQLSIAFISLLLATNAWAFDVDFGGKLREHQHPQY
jgi:hypothetical protein